MACLALGGHLAEDTQADICLLARNPLENSLTRRLVKVRFNCEKRLAELTMVFSRVLQNLANKRGKNTLENKAAFYIQSIG